MANAIEHSTLLMHNYIYPSSPALIAKCLSRQMIGALAVGRAETGPRALGNRSIVADCRYIKTKERINGLIKHRAAYQPLAPICLEEDFDNYFCRLRSDANLDFMQFALSCKQEALRDIPAVVHADCTARTQVVRSQQYPHLHEILLEYKKLTGVGVLINTSFNGRNEPMVNTLGEAYAAYKRMGLDFLALDDCFLSRHRL